MDRDELLKELVNAMNTQRTNIEEYNFYKDEEYLDNDCATIYYKKLICSYRDAINKITNEILEMED